MATGRIGLFGGSFNPPHIAHLAVAEATREQAGLSRVIWIPAAASPFKPDEEMPAPHHRLEMVRLATADNPAFEVSDVEIARGGTSFTVETVEEIGAQFPNATLSLLIGGDSLRSFPEWRRSRDIVSRASLVVYRRPGDGLDLNDLPEWLTDRVSIVNAPAIDLSATEIRKLLADNRSARYLIPESVRKYIAARGLYRPSR